MNTPQPEKTLHQLLTENPKTNIEDVQSWLSQFKDEYTTPEPTRKKQLFFEAWQKLREDQIKDPKKTRFELLEPIVEFALVNLVDSRGTFIDHYKNLFNPKERKENANPVGLCFSLLEKEQDKINLVNQFCKKPFHPRLINVDLVFQWTPAYPGPLFYAINNHEKALAHCLLLNVKSLNDASQINHHFSDFISDNNLSAIQFILSLDTRKLNFNLNHLDIMDYTKVKKSWIMTAIGKRQELLKNSKDNAEALEINLNIIKAFVNDPRCNINITDSNHETALHHALKLSPINLELIEILLQKGANVNIQNMVLLSPLAIVEAIPVDSTDPDRQTIASLKKLFSEYSRKKINADLKATVSEALQNNSFYLSRITATDVPISTRMHAQINIDHKLRGTHLEGSELNETLTYSASMLHRILDRKLLDISDPEKLTIQSLHFQLQGALELDKLIHEALLKGFQLEKPTKNQSFAEEKEFNKKNNQEKKAIIVELSNKIWNKFKTNESKGISEIAIPGGWRAFPHGHAMLYKIKRLSNGDIEFSIFNSGAGSQFHPPKNTKRKKRSSPTLKCIIPKGQETSAISLIQNIMGPLLMPIWDKKNFEAHQLYKKILECVPQIIADHSYMIMAISGQRSGTCAWKVIGPLLKDALPRELYRKIKLEIKFQSDCEFYDKCAKDGSLVDPQIRQQLIDSINNNSRLIRKIIEKEKNKRQDLKTLTDTYSPYITVLNLMMEDVKNRKAKSYTAQTIPDLAALSTYQEQGVYDAEASEHNIIEQSMTQFDDIERACLEDKPLGTYSFPTKFSFTNDPLSDLQNLQKMIQELENNMLDKDSAITYLIEEFMINIPLQGDQATTYWTTLQDTTQDPKMKKEKIMQYFSLIASLQRTYAHHLKSTSNSATPNRILTTYGFSAVCFLCADAYYQQQGGRSKFLHPTRDQFNKDKNNLLFYIDNEEQSARLKELNQYFHLRYYIHGNNFEKIALLHSIDGKKLDREALISLITPEIRKKIEAWIKNNRSHRSSHYYDAPNINDIINLEEFIVFCLYTDAPEKIKNPDLMNDLNFFALYKSAMNDCNNILHNENLNYYQPMSSTILLPVIQQEISRSTTRYGEGYDSTKPGCYMSVDISYCDSQIKSSEQSKFIETLIPVSSQEMIYPLYAAKEKEPEYDGQRQVKYDNYGKTVYRTVLKMKDGYFYENYIQVSSLSDTDKKEINDSISYERRLRSTRSHNLTVITSTIAHYLSHTEKLASVDEQYIFICNLQNPSAFNNELVNNPHVGLNLLELLNKASQFFEIGIVSLPLTFLFKVNAFLMNEVKDILLTKKTLSKDTASTLHNVYALSEKFVDKLNQYLERNNPDIRRFSSDVEKIQAEIVQRNLHYARLQHLEHVCRFNLKPIDDTLIADYLASQFYISGTDNLSQQPSDRVDAMAKAMRINVEFYFKDAVIKFFSGKAPTEILSIVTSLYPQLKNKISYTEKSILKFNYPILLCKNEANDSILVNVLSGKILSKGRELKYLPAWFFSNPGLTSLFGSKMREGYVSQGEERIEFMKNGHEYLVTKTPLQVFKKITINGKTSWYQYKRAGHYVAYLPKHIVDRNHCIWVDTSFSQTGLHSVVFSNENNGNNEYILQNSQLFKMDGAQLRPMAKLYHQDRFSTIRTPFDFLKDFEGAEFLEVVTDKPITLFFPRYGFSFIEKNGELEWSEDSRYVLDQSIAPDEIPNFACQLKLKPRESHSHLDAIMLLPLQPFIATGEKQIDLDKHGIYLEDQLQLFKEQDEQYREKTVVNKFTYAKLDKSDHDFESPEWEVKSLSKYVQAKKAKNGELIGTNSLADLYLCYINATKNVPEAALSALARFEKQGFSGTRQELELLKFMLGPIPYQISSPLVKEKEAHAVLHQASSIIQTPELIAIQARVLVDLIQFLMAQNRFDLESNIQDPANLDAYAYITSKSNEFLNNLPSTIQDILSTYLSVEKNIPIHMRLNALDEYTLYKYLKSEPLSVQLDTRSKIVTDHYQKRERMTYTLPDSDLLLSYQATTSSVVQGKEELPRELKVSRGIQEWVKSKGEGWATYGKVLPFDQVDVSISDDDFIVSFIDLYHIAINGTPTQKQKLEEIMRSKVSGYFTFWHISCGSTSSLENKDVIASVLNLQVLLLYVLKEPDKFPADPTQKPTYYSYDSLNMRRLQDAIADCKPIRIPISKYEFTAHDKPLKPMASFETQKMEPFLQPTRVELAALPSVEKQPFNLIANAIEAANAKIDTKDLEGDAKRHFDKPEVTYPGMDIEDYVVGQQLNQKTAKRNEIYVKALKDQTRRDALKSSLESNASVARSSVIALEEQILALANKPSGVISEAWLETTRYLGREKNRLDMPDLIALYLRSDIREFREKTNLTDAQIKKLLQFITEYLLKQTQIQQCERVLNALKEIEDLPQNASEGDYRDRIVKLGELLYAEKGYEYDKANNHRLLAYEYLEGIILKRNQVKTISDLLTAAATGGYINRLIQLIMGSGKTTVLIPVTACLRADGTNLVFIVVQDKLFQSNLNDFKTTFARLGRKAIGFKFDRDTLTGDPTKDENILEEILDTFKLAMLNKNSIVTTPNSIKSLKLKWIELLKTKNPVYGNCIKKLEDIITLMKTHGDAFFDEVDETLKLKHELIYSFDDKAYLNPNINKHGIALHRLCSKVSFEFKNQSYTMQDVFSGKFPDLDEPEWKKFYKRNIQTKLVNTLCDSFLMKSIISKLQQNMSDKDVKGAAEKILNQLKTYLKDESTVLPSFLSKLSPDEREIINFYKQELSQLLPLTSVRKIDVDFGFTRLERLDDEAERSMAIPYSGNNSPNEKSKFASPYETHNYTILINLLHGLQKYIVVKFIEDFKARAQQELEESNYAIAPEKSEVVQEFCHLTGISVEDFFRLNVNNEIILNLFYEKFRITDSVVDYCLENYILNNNKINPTVLRENAINSSAGFRSKTGFSGTISNPYEYDDDLVFDNESAKGTNGQTEDIILRKNFPVRIAKPGKGLPAIQEHILNNPSMRMLIDTGNHFQGIPNEAVARDLARLFQEKQRAAGKPTEPLKFVLYLDQNDLLCAIPVENPNTNQIILIGETSEKVIIDKLGCKPENRFTYCDGLHDRGLNIAQMRNAAALQTENGQVTFERKVQASSRLRLLADAQTVEYCINPTYAESFPKEKIAVGISSKDLLENNKRNSDAKKYETNYKAAMYKLHQAIRENVENVIQRQPNVNRKFDLLDRFKQFLIFTLESSATKLFEGVATEEQTNILLNSYKEHLFISWKNAISDASIGLEAEFLASEIETMNDKLEKIYKHALTQCAKTTTVTSADHSAELEHVSLKQRETQKEKEAEKERQQAIRGHQALQATPFGLEEWNEIDLSTFSCENSSTYGPRIMTVNQLLEASHGSQRPPFAFNHHLFISENQFCTVKTDQYFSAYTKPIHFVMFIQRGIGKESTLEALVLSQSDVNYTFTDLVRNHNGEPTVWITTPNEVLHAGQPPSADKLNPKYQEIMEQIWYLNGDTAALGQQADKLSWTIDDQYNHKISYLENHILPSFPDNARPLPWFKKQAANQKEYQQKQALRPEDGSIDRKIGEEQAKILAPDFTRKKSISRQDSTITPTPGTTKKTTPDT